MSDRWLSLLLTQAWQLTLVIVVVALLSRRFANKRPHLAVALWLVVLAKAITPPVWSSPLGVFSWSIPTSAPAPVEVAPARSTPPPITASAPLPTPEPWPAPSTELISLLDEPAEAPLIPATAPPAEIHLPAADRGPTEPRRWSWTGVALSLWLAGAGLTLLILCSRLLHLWRMLSRAGAGPHAELAAQVDTLRKRLKLRRRVRVWVTPTDHGPAVLGLFRPWLLLPRTLVDQVAPADLEPLLVHELLHIRRGDLWIGWWQAVVQAAWWLHPLVWWSNRVLTRQLERCCDEEVLAELGCEPARYARGLLKALELKHRLQPVPAAPGVRPVDLTAERMERIMRTGQGSRRRTPWWCWGVLGVGLLVTLPGAGLQLGAEEPAKVLAGVGVNSDAGVAGTVVLEEAAEQPSSVNNKPDQEQASQVTQPTVKPYSPYRPTIVRQSPIQFARRLEGQPEDPQGNSPFGKLQFEVREPLTVDSLQLKEGQSNLSLSRSLGIFVKMRAKELGYPFAGVTLTPGTGENFRDTIFKVGPGPRATPVELDQDATGEVSDPAAPPTLRYQTALPADVPPYSVCSTIENYFREFGYFSVKATAETVSAERRDYIVERGPEHLIRNVHFDAAVQIPKRELREFLGIQPGQRFFGDTIRARAEWLRLFLGLRHPVFSTWLAIPRMAGDQPVVDLIFVSHPDLPQADWNRITTHPQRPAYADTRNPLHAWPYEAPVECQNGDKVYLYVGNVHTPIPYLLGAKERAKQANNDNDLSRVLHCRTNPAIRVAEKLALERQLDKRITEHLKSMRLIESVSQLCDRQGIAVTFDQSALDAARVDSETRVSGEFNGVALGTVLRTLVEPLGLSIAERGGVLVVTDPRRLLQTDTRAYSVADLLGDSETRPSDESHSLVLLDELIRSTVRPESWVGRGGPGSIQTFETTLSLVIRQTPEAHEEIATLFDSLRQNSSAKWPPKNRLEWLQPRRREFTQIVSVSANNEPLDRVLRQLCEDCHLQLIIDRVAIAEAGLDSTVRVTGEYREVPIYRCLEGLCNGTPGLWWELVDHTLRLTTRRHAGESIELRSYPATDLVAPRVVPTDGWESLMQPGALGLAPGSDELRLMHAIKAYVEPLSWAEIGGPGDLKYYSATRSLAVRQTSRGHERLQWYFDDLRKSRTLKIELRAAWRTLSPAEFQALNPDASRVCLAPRDAQDQLAPAVHRVTVANGQSIESPVDAVRPNAETLKLVPVLSDNLRTIALTILPTHQTGRFAPSVVYVPDGQTVVIDVSNTLSATDPALRIGGRVVLQLTPRIVAVENRAQKK